MNVKVAGLCAASTTLITYTPSLSNVSAKSIFSSFNVTFIVTSLFLLLSSIVICTSFLVATPDSIPLIVGASSSSNISIKVSIRSSKLSLTSPGSIFPVITSTSLSLKYISDAKMSSLSSDSSTILSTVATSSDASIASSTTSNLSVSSCLTTGFRVTLSSMISSASSTVSALGLNSAFSTAFSASFSGLFSVTFLTLLSTGSNSSFGLANVNPISPITMNRIKAKYLFFPCMFSPS